MGRACGMYGENGNTRKVLLGKIEGTRPLRRHGYRLQDNVKIDFKRNRDVNWIHLARDRETVMNLLVLKNSSFLTS
jgi:hypothetical protein